MVICKICSHEFANINSLMQHLRQNKEHIYVLCGDEKNISISKAYYDRYLLKNCENLCPICHGEKSYHGLTLGYSYRNTCSERCGKQKLRDDGFYNSGKFGGTSVTENKMIELYGEVDGRLRWKNKNKKQSDSMKIKIENGLFTPCITNTWTHQFIEIIYDNKKYKFRSSWECAFFLYNIKNNVKLYYEKHRFRYIDTDGKSRIYITDFSKKLKDRWVIYEIKPTSCRNDDNVKLKELAAINECEKNNNVYVIIETKDLEKIFKSLYNDKEFYNNYKEILDKVKKGLKIKE